MAGGVTESVGPEFKPQYHQKKKKKRFGIVFRCHWASTPSTQESSHFPDQLTLFLWPGLPSAPVTTLTHLLVPADTSSPLSSLPSPTPP
jgi:hypothetical protein